jgi:hypothetical protein
VGRVTAFVGSTNVLELRGLKNAVDDEFIDDATVTVTVKDAAGTNVSGQGWPLTMDYVADSDGDYRAILENDIAFVARRTYFAHISANAGTNRIATWKFAFTPQTRAD